MSDVRSARLSEPVFLLLLVLIGLALRLDFLFASNFVLDSDEAIVGLMAKHIYEGGPVPIFYYGQHYMGSFEAILVSGLFTLFGVSSAAVKVVPLLFSLGLIVLVYRLAREVTNEFGARAAALLTAIPPSPLVIWSAMARGGFIELVVIGAAALLLTCRWLKAPQPSLAASAVIGLFLGFGWWVNFQIVFFVGPIGLFMLLRLLRSGRGFPGRIVCHLVAGAAAFMLGSAPFWIYNLEHQWASFEMFKAAKEGRFEKHLAGLFELALPTILGAKRFWHEEDIFWGATAIAAGLYGAILVGVLALRYRAIASLAVLRCDRERPVELFLVFIIGACVVFCASSFGFLVQAPRYLLPTYVGFFVLGGFVLGAVAERSRSAAALFTAIFAAFHLASSYAGGRAVPGEPFVHDGERVSRDHTELIAWLAEKDIRYVRTNYWIGYRLAFETGERVLFRTFQEPEAERIPEYIAASAPLEREELPLILVPAQYKLVKRALKLQGFTFKSATRSGYKIIFDLKRPPVARGKISPAEFQAVAATSRPEQVNLAFDGDAETRWGSGEPQKPGMEFSIDFKNPQVLAGLRYDLGPFHSDFPRSLDIVLELPSGEEWHVIRREDVVALRYYEDALTLSFPPVEVQRVVFRQLGRDGVFDWSIAELEFFH